MDDLNNLAKTNLKNENDSWSAIIKNGKSNLLSFCKVLAINHLVITASSAYTAETLTWESYPIKLLSIPNILSTVVRATVMKLVNEYCIKDGLSIIFKLIRKYCCCNLAATDNNSENLIVKMKNWVNNQNKPMQSLLLVGSFLVTCALTNAIKAYAADIAQNKGDSEAAWKQFKRTFFRLGMVLSALGVTASDLYNLTQEMKPFLKLKNQSKQNQEIIEKALLELSNSIVNNSTADLDDEPLITIEDQNFNVSDIDDDPFISITDEISNINGINSLANDDIDLLSPWNEANSTYPINNDHEILINNNSRVVKTCTIS